MPATNILMYVPTGSTVRPVAYYETKGSIDDPSSYDIRNVVSQDSSPKPANGYLTNPYYLNNNQSETQGYIFIPVPYQIDLSNVYIWSNGQWVQWLLASQVMTHEVVTIYGAQYNSYYFGEPYDEDFDEYPPTMRNISFVLI